MHPTNAHNPGLMQIASQAQTMAKGVQQDRMAVAFQTVAMVSMAIMGVTAAARLIRDLQQSEKPGRGR
jgi:hypothetical protein